MDDKLKRLKDAIDRAEKERRLAKSLAMAAEIRFEECRTALHTRNARLYAANSGLEKAKEALSVYERDKTD
jgi:hypothetical protein